MDLAFVMSVHGKWFDLQYMYGVIITMNCWQGPDGNEELTVKSLKFAIKIRE
jgi:hypothetical protein